MHFSLTRLLLAVTAFATAFSAFSYLGFAGIAVSTLIGVSVGAICLIVKPDQIWPMVRTGLMTILGGFNGLMFAPWFTHLIIRGTNLDTSEWVALLDS